MTCKNNCFTCHFYIYGNCAVCAVMLDCSHYIQEIIEHTEVIMIKIIADFKVKEDAAEKFMELAKEIVECTRKEEGNISYHLHENIKDNNQFTFVEEWKDKDAIEAHNNSEHFTRILPEIGALLAEKPVIKIYKEVL